MKGPGRRGRRPRIDLFDLPIVGRALRHRHASMIARTLLFGVALLLFLDGLFGPQLPHRNLAGVLPWVHWRGFLILALLVAGNFFCFACPFLLPRKLAARLRPAGRNWPVALRSKWGALGLLFLFLWGYEVFSLWASPWLTAWIVAAYFVAAFAIDLWFKGAPFCKYVCPIGQFNFVHATMSPFEVAVRDPEVCLSCRTKDCIRGTRPSPSRAGSDPSRAGSGVPLPVLPARLDPTLAAPSPLAAPGAPPAIGTFRNGCELWLFQPAKTGNLDCTFCMDCVHACPHDNIGILSREPGAELSSRARRSGIGRLEERLDYGALALFLVFAAFMNAFGMVSPIHRATGWFSGLTGITSPRILVGTFFLAGLLLLPTLVTLGTAQLSRLLAGSDASLARTIARYGWGLVPIGFGMWSAHYLFHFLAGLLTIIPVTQQYLIEIGIPVFGSPAWVLGPVLPTGAIRVLELLLLETGFLISLIVLARIAMEESGNDRRRMILGALPWWVLAGILSGSGIWLLFQPMEMRGMLGG